MNSSIQEFGILLKSEKKRSKEVKWIIKEDDFRIRKRLNFEFAKKNIQKPDKKNTRCDMRKFNKNIRKKHLCNLSEK